MPDSSETGATGGKSATGRGLGSYVTRLSLLALVARHPAISRRTVMNNAG